MCACPGKHKALGPAKTCEEACFGRPPASGGNTGNTGSTPSTVHAPSVDHEALRLAREAEEQAKAEEARRRAEDAERQARFIRDRDAAAVTLRGSIGISAGANSNASELRGSDTVAVGRQLRGTAQQPDVSGRHAAWKQLHCAASILGPGISAAVKEDYAESRFLLDEAANALNGQRLRVTCPPAPEMPRYSGPAIDPGRQAEVEKRLVEKARDLATKLEDARRKQSDAQAALRGPAAPKVEAPTDNVVEQQRRINRARDDAANANAKAQRDFNEGKRSEESAKKELNKIQEKVESVVLGERITWDEDPPVASRGSKK